MNNRHTIAERKADEEYLSGGTQSFNCAEETPEPKTTTECVAWFEDQCESNRRKLTITVCVPNSDSCVYYVNELLKGEWRVLGDGYCLTDALNNAMANEVLK